MGIRAIRSACVNRRKTRDAARAREVPCTSEGPVRSVPVSLRTPSSFPRIKIPPRPIAASPAFSFCPTFSIDMPVGRTSASLPSQHRPIGTSARPSKYWNRGNAARQSSSLLPDAVQFLFDGKRVERGQG
jgi:hypothetical protein